MAVADPSPTLPEAAEEEPACSGAAAETFGTYFCGRGGNHSLPTSDQWGNLAWVVSKRGDRISLSSFSSRFAGQRPSWANPGLQPRDAESKKQPPEMVSFVF